MLREQSKDKEYLSHQTSDKVLRAKYSGAQHGRRPTVGPAEQLRQPWTPPIGLLVV